MSVRMFGNIRQAVAGGWLRPRERLKWLFLGLKRES